MPFPEVQRVIYKKNPLDQVICQIRFPRILRIDTELPSEFQNNIITEFPEYVGKQESNLLMPANMPHQVPKVIVNQVRQKVTSINHEFTSENNHWKVNLTSSFLALTANNYKQWEEFKKKLIVPFGSLNNTYSPKYFSRIGLRYTDVFRRSELGLDGIPWRELLNTNLLGLLGASCIEGAVTNFQNTYELKLPNSDGFVNIKTMFVQPHGEQEECYMIDSDFFTEKSDPQSVMQKLDRLHDYASRLIRWCIKDQLHEAMEPAPLQL